MVNYSNGKIYKIVPTNGDEMCYIGSTTKQYLSQRMVSHKAEYKMWLKNDKQGKTSSHELFEKYGVENCKIILIENFPCNSKDELEKREGECIKTLNCINKRGAGGVSISGMVGKVKPPPQEIEESDDISVLSDSSVSETKSGSNPQMGNYILDVPDEPTSELIPSREELIEIINKYEKYQHLFPSIKKQIQWEKNNINIDLNYFRQKHIIKMRYILFKIALLKCNDLTI